MSNLVPSPVSPSYAHFAAAPVSASPDGRAKSSDDALPTFDGSSGAEIEILNKCDADESDESDANWLADEEYWEDEIAADEWLAENPGGTRLLYPQLFVVKQRDDKVSMPCDLDAS